MSYFSYSAFDILVREGSYDNIRKSTAGIMVDHTEPDCSKILCVAYCICDVNKYTRYSRFTRV